MLKGKKRLFKVQLGASLGKCKMLPRLPCFVITRISLKQDIFLSTLGSNLRRLLSAQTSLLLHCSKFTAQIYKILMSCT